MPLNIIMKNFLLTGNSID